MVVLFGDEIESTIKMLTKYREKGINHVIMHRHGEAMQSQSIMGICNADGSIVVPMYNWTIEEIKDYITSPMQRISIDVMNDVDFAFFYTLGRRVTWRKPLANDRNFLSNKGNSHDDAVRTALNREIRHNSQN